jgi:hypothetical protein
MKQPLAAAFSFARQNLDERRFGFAICAPADDQEVHAMLATRPALNG